MSYENIVVTRDEGVGTIRLNRPKVLNALSRSLYREVDTAIGELEADDEIKVLVFTGTGDRAFSAGADIHEQVRDAENPPPPDPRRPEQAWHVASCTKPTVAALNGLCYGGGAVMASSFDIRVGCERTSFRFLAASYGRVNSTWSLPMQVGWPMAKELLFTARVVEAEEAHRIGLLNHLVSTDELMPKAMEIARQIVGNDSRMVQGIKELLMDDVGASWRGMYDNEANARMGKLSPTSVEEGFKEFLDRKGRR
ncbi:MAG: enoyl-CoA hydratase/isomerase family protein [Chloroflexi bacterium]|nr:enoyl-CoA hydratase/isomerase family protein [Chloroflexota bacterium]MCI0868211.1 enoyl-CoA hydratase/isomerase family protein [Chloroflexota bacterium]